ncbi:MAG: helix-turn-helix transcriptional regulator [Clostridia bacterium]|nr:helix-turn-helix transcriptional regulator [Clostridia bacterium]MBR2176300.1 helix-turn-helix transcriptional regulator [Clostridia bacterium]
MVQKTVGENIQKFRKIKGLTQEQLAELVSLSPNYLSAVERGIYQLKYDKLVEIMNCLNCTPNDIFSGTFSCGYQIRASRLSDEIENLSQSEQKRIFDVVEVLIKNAQ